MRTAARSSSICCRWCRATRPFLVDSVMGELVAQGLSIRAMLHPVIASAQARSAPALGDLRP